MIRLNIKKILLVTKYTFLEVLKSKIMVSVGILALALLVVCLVASEFAYGDAKRVALDFGLGSLSLSSVGMAIFIGATLINKEMENRTIYMILSRPISRESFYLGRFFGMTLMLALNVAILGLTSYGFYLFLGGGPQGLIFWTFLFTFFEAVILLSVVLLFSLICNTILTVIFSLSVFIVGHALSDTVVLGFVQGRDLLRLCIKAYTFVFPNFSKINLRDYVLYEQDLPSSLLLSLSSYSVIYTGLILVISMVVFSRKNLD